MFFTYRAFIGCYQFFIYDKVCVGRRCCKQYISLGNLELIGKVMICSIRKISRMSYGLGYQYGNHIIVKNLYR